MPPLGAVAPPRRFIADRAYDANGLRRWLDERRVEAVIPSTASRAKPDPLDRRACGRRNVVERPHLPPEGLVAAGHALRPPRPQPPRRPRPRGRRQRVDLNESPVFLNVTERKRAEARRDALVELGDRLRGLPGMGADIHFEPEGVHCTLRLPPLRTDPAA